jgi:hypothetical protein
MNPTPCTRAMTQLRSLVKIFVAVIKLGINFRAQLTQLMRGAD